MAYSDLQQNQTISLNNLQSGVAQGAFTAKTTIPSGTKQITKTEANTYVNINTSLPSFATKAANELVTKEDLSGVTVTSPYVMYGVAGTAAYKSIDGGTTFTALSGLTSAYTWTGIAGDSTGTYIAVISSSQNNTIYISSDGGSSFTAITIGAFAGFNPRGVAMSNNGQYVSVSGITAQRAFTFVSSNYGTSFSLGYGDSTTYDMYTESAKVSVSGNGQYMTAIFSYEVDPGGVNNPRPWSFRVYSSDYGVSWTKSGGSEFARFFDIALDGTGQNQFLTIDYLEPGVFGRQGIKAYVSNNFGASFTEKYSNTVGSSASSRRVGFTSATISDNGQVMVGATDEVSTTSYYQPSSYSPLVISSFNSGSSFTSSDGYTNNVAIAGGTAVTTGVTNNYIAMMLRNIGQFNYSVNGGTSFTPKATTARAWYQIYRKALLYATPTTTTTTTACPGANWVASGSFYYTCSAGTVTSTIVYIDDRPCSPTYNKYKLNDVVYTTNPGNAYPSTTQVWTDTGITRCNECVNEKEQEQTNECATGYGTKRWVAGGSACSTTQTWTNTGTFDCYGTCNKYNVEKQTNPCATQYNETRQGSEVDSNSTFCAGCCGQSTAADWENDGSAFCSDCVAYQPQIDNNPCSATYNNTRNVNLGATAPCSYVANWENVGSPFCSECVVYQLQIDTNPCSSTYDDSRYVNLGAGAPCTYTAIWENRDINIYYVCEGVDKYYEQIDVNPCSSTYNTTRTGALYQSNSTDCGYVGTFTISWSLTDVTTGTANMQIYKNSSLIVNQSGDGSGSFTVTSSDVVYYTLSGTSPNFTYVQINDSVHGVIADCNFNSAFVNSFPGYSYSGNASIDGLAIDYIDGCP